MAWVIDHLPVLPHQVGVTGVPVSGVVENLLNAGEVDVQQQHALAHLSILRQLHRSGQGYHPAVAAVRVIKQVLHMGQGEVEVLDFVQGLPEPRLIFCRLGLLLLGCRGTGQHVSLRVQNDNAHQQILVGVVQQLNLLPNVIHRQVMLFDHPIVGRLGHPHHVLQVHVQVQSNLFHQTGVVLLHHGLRRGEKAGVQHNPHQCHGHQGDAGKGQSDGILDVLAAKPLQPVGQYLLNPPHLHSSPSYSGTSWGRPRTAF